MAAATDAGPNDIIIHLVNPYKCSDCGSEFFSKNLFIDHMAEHIDKMKAQNPCYQIVCGVNLASQQGNSITVTRDILQINENQMFELQDSSLDYTQLTPLRVLEQAGILNLPQSQKVGSDITCITNASNDCVNPCESRDQGTNTISLPQRTLHQEIPLMHGEIDNSPASSVLKSHGGQAAMLPLMETTSHPQNLHPQNIHASNLESVVQQPFVMNEALKDELNVIIETSAPVATSGMAGQEQFPGMNELPMEGLKEMKGWGDGDLEAIMAGKHIVLVKKVLTHNYEEPRNGRAVCKICYNEFANKNVLMRHQVVHTGVKPHCCFTCFKEFNDISSLRKHLLIHKRSHKCPICLKMFLRRRQMEIHLRQHNKKRFIQFGHKYHEVHVSTCRNEWEQIVHEFSLSALMNMNDKTKTTPDSVSLGKNLIDEGPIGSRNSNGCVNGQPDVKPLGTESLSGVSQDRVEPNENPTLDRVEPHEKLTVDGLEPKEKPTVDGVEPKEKPTVDGVEPKEKPTVDGVEPKEKPILDRVGPNEKPTLDRVEPHEKPTVDGVEPKEKPTLDRVEPTPQGSVLPITDKGASENSRSSPSRNSQSSFKKVIYKCGHCKKLIYTRPTLSRHLMLHTNEKPFQCEKCGKDFRHKSDLVHHYKTHLKPVKCQTCGSAFSKQLYLKKHLEKGCPFIEENNKNFTLLSDLTYQCNLCHKILKSRVNIFRHLRVHAFEERKFQETDSKKVSKMLKNVNGYGEGGNTSDDSSKNVNNFIHPLSNCVGFQCTICGEEFRFKSFILIHVRMHLNQRPFVCKECGCGFFGRYQLRKHQQNHTRPYKCPKCGRGFNRRYLMTHHFNKNHSEDSEEKMKDITILPDKKLLRCDICGKTMKSFQKSLMQYHIRLHKDVRPYKCQECHKTFISDIALKKHLLNHSKPYICQICRKGFSRRYLMIEHFEKYCKRKRPGVKPSSSVSFNSTPGNAINETESDSQAPYEAETVVEMDKTSGTEVFRCVPCDKTFTVKEALVRHMKTFKRRTACKYCKLEFSDKHLTLAHQRCCLGFGVEIKDADRSRKSKTVSQRQETVLKVMEEMNLKIANYAEMAETRNDIGHVENDPTLITETTSAPLPVDDEERECQDSTNNSSNATLRDKRKRIISALTKQTRYPCPECKKSFLTTRGLKIHASSHVRLYQCEICGHDFTQIKAFRDHAKQHGEEKSAENGLDNKVGVEVVPPPKLPAQAAESNPRKESHSGKPKADITKISVPEKCASKNSNQSSQSRSPRVKDVDMVGAKGHTDVTARLMLFGTRGRPFSCKQCRRRFTEQAGLTAHVSQIHSLENLGCL